MRLGDVRAGVEVHGPGDERLDLQAVTRRSEGRGVQAAPGPSDADERELDLHQALRVDAHSHLGEQGCVPKVKQAERRPAERRSEAKVELKVAPTRAQGNERQEHSEREEVMADVVALSSGEVVSEAEADCKEAARLPCDRPPDAKSQAAFAGVLLLRKAEPAVTSSHERRAQLVVSRRGGLRRRCCGRRQIEVLRHPCRRRAAGRRQGRG